MILPGCPVVHQLYSQVLLTGLGQETGLQALLNQVGLSQSQRLAEQQAQTDDQHEADQQQAHDQIPPLQGLLQARVRGRLVVACACCRPCRVG